eukprot:237096-Pleurochrysis_carterae.AAC.2
MDVQSMRHHVGVGVLRQVHDMRAKGPTIGVEHDEKGAARGREELKFGGVLKHTAKRVTLRAA